MRLEFSDFVEHDLEAIGDYIAQGSPSRAVTFVIEIRCKIKQVALNPLIYRLRPEIGVGARLEMTCPLSLNHS